eukprot:s270_g19.t1
MLRQWRRQLLRAGELGLHIPDPLLQVNALSEVMRTVVVKEPRASFRISNFRMTHMVDVAPTQLTAENYLQMLIAEADHLHHGTTAKASPASSNPKVNYVNAAGDKGGGKKGSPGKKGNGNNADGGSPKGKGKTKDGKNDKGKSKGRDKPAGGVIRLRKDSQPQVAQIQQPQVQQGQQQATVTPASEQAQSAQPSVIGEVASLLKAMRTTSATPRVLAVMVDNNQGVLLDSRATHILRGSYDETEWMLAIPTEVQTATDEMQSQVSRSLLTKVDLQPIVPLGMLTQHG